MSLVWKIEFSETVKQQLKKLDRNIAARLINWLEDRVLSGANNPRLWGESLRVNRKYQWRYRVGDYRIVCEILDSTLIVKVLEIGHRREIYRA